MSKNPKSNRAYSGQFHVAKVYPKYILKDGFQYELVDAKTVSFVVPDSEAIELANAILKARSETPDSIEIKVDLRDEKKRKRDGLLHGTVTFLNKSIHNSDQEEESI